MKKTVIGLTGQPAAGKETFTKFLIAMHQPDVIEVVHSGNYLKEECLRRGLTDERKNMQQLLCELEKKDGAGAVTRIMEARIQSSQAKVVIFDSVRMNTDFDMLMRQPKRLLVYITADEYTRFKRARARREKAGEQFMSFEDFLESERAVTEKQIKRFAKHAHCTIDNSGSLKELERQVDDFCFELLLPKITT